MDIVKVLEILNKHILDLETESQYKDWKIEELRKENEHLKSYIDAK